MRTLDNAGWLVVEGGPKTGVIIASRNTKARAERLAKYFRDNASRFYIGRSIRVVDDTDVRYSSTHDVRNLV